jgi:hypothetical protein
VTRKRWAWTEEPSLPGLGEIWRFGAKFAEQYQRSGRWPTEEELFYRAGLLYLAEFVAYSIRTEDRKTPVRRKILCAKRNHLLGEVYSVNHEFALFCVDRAADLFFPALPQLFYQALARDFSGELVRDLRLPDGYHGPLWLARMRPQRGGQLAWIDWPGWGGADIGLPWDLAGIPDPALPAGCTCGERAIPVRVLTAFTRQEAPLHLRI